MKELILHPVGRAEPEDAQGWFEQGGGLGLQMAWQLSPAELRARLSHIRRRDGLGLLETAPIPAAVITIDLSNPIQRYLALEMPAFVIEGALIWARACEEPTVVLQVTNDTSVTTLLDETAGQFKRLGIIGKNGWSGISVRLVSYIDSVEGEVNALAPDARTARIMPLVLWEHADPSVTLLQTTGKFHTTSLFEIPLGLTIRDFVFNWAGGIPQEGTLSLGGRLLTRSEWELPLTYEQWGRDLGWGVLDCS